ncbi:hypothetical protein A3Q56_01375 [Intoshia linei]|uniref:CUT domain-containing protein n=1 Tax=Intoshia linei TaxID=1819745 RepID=A0A177B999_9BILA|nr:hypothetical protein A3Q56_01375 [Intoshia linei]
MASEWKKKHIDQIHQQLVEFTNKCLNTTESDKNSNLHPPINTLENYLINLNEKIECNNEIMNKQQGMIYEKTILTERLKKENENKMSMYEENLQNVKKVCQTNPMTDKSKIQILTCIGEQIISSKLKYNLEKENADSLNVNNNNMTFKSHSNISEMFQKNVKKLKKKSPIKIQNILPNQLKSNNLKQESKRSILNYPSALKTHHVAKSVKILLMSNKINQRVFAKYILNVTQGTASDLLSKPKPWEGLTTKGRQSYFKMYHFLNDGEKIEKLRNLKYKHKELKNKNTLKNLCLNLEYTYNKKYHSDTEINEKIEKVDNFKLKEYPLTHLKKSHNFKRKYQYLENGLNINMQKRRVSEIIKCVSNNYKKSKKCKYSCMNCKSKISKYLKREPKIKNSSQNNQIDNILTCDPIKIPNEIKDKEYTQKKLTSSLEQTTPLNKEIFDKKDKKQKTVQNNLLLNYSMCKILDKTEKKNSVQENNCIDSKLNLTTTFQPIPSNLNVQTIQSSNNIHLKLNNMGFFNFKPVFEFNRLHKRNSMLWNNYTLEKFLTIIGIYNFDITTFFNTHLKMNHSCALAFCFIPIRFLNDATFLYFSNIIRQIEPWVQVELVKFVESLMNIFLSVNFGEMIETAILSSTFSRKIEETEFYKYITNFIKLQAKA